MYTKKFIENNINKELKRRLKISKSMKGVRAWSKGMKKENNQSLKNLSNSLKKHFSENNVWNKGKKNCYSPKTRYKMGAGKRNKKESIETRMKKSKWHKKHAYWKGKKLPKYLKEKLSKSHKGKKLSEEHKLAISKANKGNPKLAYWKGKKQSKKIIEKRRISFSNYLNKTRKKYNLKKIVSYNKKACQFFNELNKIYKLNGQHAEYKGEKQIIGYFLDYYEPKLNLVIEWNEENHYELNRLNIKHQKRQYEIKKYLKCYFINIRQKTFKKENIYKRIEKLIRKKYIKLVA